MRQFLSLRFWLTVLALVGSAAVLALVLGGGDAPASEIGAATDGESHEVNLIAAVQAVTEGVGFAMVDGRATADLELRLDEQRSMLVTSGTPGEVLCGTLDQPGTCLVAADLLGDAVLWFSVVPGETGAEVDVPGVVELMGDNTVRLANGWVVRRASLVTRTCDAETTSLSNFVDTYGESATSVFDLATQVVVEVVCPAG